MTGAAGLMTGGAALATMAVARAAWRAMLARRVLARLAPSGRHRGAVARSWWLLGPVGRPVERGVSRVVGVARARREQRRAESGIPDVLEAIARSLRGGASMRQALADAAGGAPEPLAADLQAIGRVVGEGVPLSGALEAWAAARPLPGVRLAVAAIVLGGETGGAEARTIDGVAATARARLDLRREVRALSAQARASAVVLVVAPVAFAVLAAASDTATAAFLLGTPIGLACLFGGLGLDLLGAIWMARICRVEP